MKGVNLDVWSLANLQNFLTFLVQMEAGGLTDTHSIRHKLKQNIATKTIPRKTKKISIKKQKKPAYALCSNCESILYGGIVDENGRKTKDGDYIIRACKKCRWSEMIPKV